MCFTRGLVPAESELIADARRLCRLDAADKISFHSNTVDLTEPHAQFATVDGKPRSGSITFAPTDVVHGCR